MTTEVNKYNPEHVKALKVSYGSLADKLGKPFEMFTKYVKVFDIFCVAVDKFDDNKLLHGASVLYQYIDNDDDGIPDNKEVYIELVKSRATMIMFKNERQMEKNWKKFEPLEDLMTLLDLEEVEIFPGSQNPKKFDASLEECFHLVCQGYNKAYPEIFGFEHGSVLADCCDAARGGYFKKVPKKYPDSAWFTYYDKTCDYETMICEYQYWAMTSILGAQAHRRKYIDDEWKLCTKDEVQIHDPNVYKLLTDEKYKFPKNLPVAVNRISSLGKEKTFFCCV